MIFKHSVYLYCIFKTFQNKQDVTKVLLCCGGACFSPDADTFRSISVCHGRELGILCRRQSDCQASTSMTRESYDYRSKHCICITQNIDCVRLSKESLKKNYPSSTCILNTCKAAFICSINIAVCRPNKNTRQKDYKINFLSFLAKIKIRL